MDATIRTHIECMHEKLAKMDRLRANTDWLRQALFKVPRHLFIEQYYDGEGPDGIVHVRFITGIEEWINLGSPKITDYHIELINPATSDDAASHSYIDRRPNATLRFSLLDVPISRDQNRPKS